ncbi:MAG: HEAT repeat domain-containing protein [Gemmatimonadota bacterium]
MAGDVADADLDWEDPDESQLGEIRQLFNSLSKAVRAHQLYDENNPVYQRFVNGLQTEFADLWEWLDRLAIQVEEERFLWTDTEVYRSESRADSLAFLFYKDGVREIVFEPGIEKEELKRLLGVIQRARNLRPESDDLLTILWDEDLEYFDYHYVDVLAEGVELPEPGGGADQESLRLALEEESPGAEDAEAEAGVEAAASAPSGAVSTEDFNPTLYSLDPTELSQLRKEVEEEMSRNLRRAVLAALFDRLEEPSNRERQTRILQIFRTLLPNLLSRGALQPAAAVLHELSALRKGEGILDQPREEEAEKLLDDVSAPEAIREMVRALRDRSIDPDSRSLGVFLRFLKPDALPTLLWAAETEEDEEIQRVLREAVRSLAEKHRDALMRLLSDDDPVVVAGAARLAGSIGVDKAATRLASLLRHDEPAVRLAAVEAAVSLKASSAASALEAALEDQDREVRIAAARALGALRYTPASAHFRKLLKGKTLRKRDVTEMIAFFESYGDLGDPEAVTLLDDLLNGSGFLGRKESEDVRACAALALGRVGTTEAQRALEAAQKQEEPVVRSAVGRALRSFGGWREA